MSDNWIRLIPRDPAWVPDPKVFDELRDSLGDQFPHAEEIELVLDDGLQFRDCGSNFELVACPACGAELAIERWQAMMDDDYDDQAKEFLLEPFTLPCCRVRKNLNELAYTFDQGFSRFEAYIMNPQVKSLRPSEIKELEELIGCPLKVVFQHL